MSASWPVNIRISIIHQRRRGQLPGPGCSTPESCESLARGEEIPEPVVSSDLSGTSGATVGESGFMPVPIVSCAASLLTGASARGRQCSQLYVSNAGIASQQKHLHLHGVGNLFVYLQNQRQRLG